MIRTTLIAAAALIALVAAMPAQAVAPWLSHNGVEMNGLQLNGLELNGRNMQGRSMQGRSMQGRSMQGRSMQGVQPNGVLGHEATGGVTLLAIELAQ